MLACHPQLGSEPTHGCDPLETRNTCVFAYICRAKREGLVVSTIILVVITIVPVVITILLVVITIILVVSTVLLVVITPAFAEPTVVDLAQPFGQVGLRAPVEVTDVIFLIQDLPSQETSLDCDNATCAISSLE